ncbi:MAG: Bro-N domain-containing protein [Desulfovibrionaceae bacterium]
MTANINTFNFNGNDIRTIIGQDGEPWFVAKDVCDVLELTDARKTVHLLDEDERNTVPVRDSIGRIQQTFIISESGLYSLTLRSRKPQAKAFKKWITKEVLPQIRKTGVYVPEGAQLADPVLYQHMVDLMETMSKREGEYLRVIEENRRDKPKVALADGRTDGWTKFGLQDASRCLEAFL